MARASTKGAIVPDEVKGIGVLPITLTQLTDEFLLIAEELLTVDLDDADAMADIQARLTKSGAGIEYKVAAVAHMIEEREASAEQRRKIAKRIAAYAQSDERQAEWLRKYLSDNMQAVGLPAVDTPAIKVYLADNPTSMVIYDEAAIPDEYKPPVPQLDKKALRAALDAGEVVPGAKLRKEGKHVVLR